ncbi:4759_t:CDS:2, partial [Acaulospora morrowiae]
PEPRILGSKFSKFQFPSEDRDVIKFFKDLPACKWSLGTYINEIIEGPESDLTFDQHLTNFVENLRIINHMFSLPLPIKSFSFNYLKWLKSLSGKAVIQSCREFFDAKMNLEKKKIINFVVKESVNVTAQTKGFQNILQHSVLSGVEALPPEMLEDIYYVTSDNNDDEDTDDDHISYLKEPEYFDKLVNSVDLSYIAKEEEPITASSTSTIPIITTWDSFIIDDFDILKVFNCLRNSLPKKSPEVHPQYWGVMDLTGQHIPTKQKLIKKWNELVNNFKSDIAWSMVELEQFETNFFDNIE